ncbi:hypothetical protein FKV24_011005 [Lysobacter maris]|uniref:Tetratricopeptide repeat protein n=1 Tax=Marilutibacter maris TaxID=1605891 RepID=A0A508AM26_9GAMM|nr:hypothetical protein [Lysobacter maris]KAB8183895.1 hypothetical protein FKV24_011005 [Lysobacter maris]
MSFHVTSQQHARILIYVALIGTAFLYWPGLSGPFILDDPFNLDPIQLWLDGRASIAEIIFGNSSGVLGRPVSMASFWITVATGGMHPFPFKFGNLIIHLVCGLLIWQVARRILARDTRLAAHAELLGAGVSIVWLLHPINVSTVLYAVQRMAQLSTLFVLVSLWVYVSGRTYLEQGHNRKAAVYLFAAFPALLLLGVFSKENAAVAPALCLVIELAYFRNPLDTKQVKGFFGLFLALPCVLALTALLLSPERLIGLYDTRDFTLTERLLSQPRALFEYIGLLLWPRGGAMGVFVDDFATSTSLISPPSTLLAILGLFGVSIFALVLRRRAPSLFAGWFLFLVGHGVESTFLPLELYFEHRNYLPGFGLIVALLGLASLATSSKIRLDARLARVLTASVAVLITLCLGLITRDQVLIWRSQESIARHALENRPTSLRAILENTGIAIKNSDYATAMTLTRNLTSSDNPRHRLLGHIHSITVECLSGRGGSPDDLESATEERLDKVSLSEVQAFGPLAKAVAEGRCDKAIDASQVGDTIVKILDHTQAQSAASKPKWLMRTAAAQQYMRANRWSDAEAQAELAWQPGADAAVGALLTQVYIHNGKKEKASRVLSQVADRVGGYEIGGQREILRLQQKIDEMTSLKEEAPAS